MPRRYKTYAALRGAMVTRGYDQYDLARLLLVGQQSVSNRFVCRTPWTCDEMYKVMDWLGLPIDQLHIYFPPDGMDMRNRFVLEETGR